MDIKKINSGFKQLDILLKRYYFNCLFEGEEDEVLISDPEKLQQLFKPQLTPNIIEDGPRAQSATERINTPDQYKMNQSTQKQELTSPQIMQKLLFFNSKKTVDVQPRAQTLMNDQFEQINLANNGEDDSDHAINGESIQLIQNNSKMLSKSRMPTESFIPKYSFYGQDQNQNNQNPPAKSFQTLKFNDIVYMKYKHENKKENNDKQQLKSYLVITNTRNQLECVSEQVQSLDNPVANFRRCLFQIVNPRQALEIQKLGAINSGQGNQINITNKNRKDIKKGNEENKKQDIQENQVDEEEEEEGDQLVYGKQIMLYHQYSKMFLTFNPQKPAKQNGCIQCTLEKYPNSFSIFRMLPNDYSRRIGDKIFDSDVINIQEIKKSQFFLNVSITNRKDSYLLNQNVQNSVSQIYASEEQTKFKVKCYISSEQLEQNCELSDDGIAFKTGDIIKIQHLDSGAFLSVSEKKFSKYNLTCRVLNSQEEQLQTGHTDNLVIRGLEQNKIFAPENFVLLYETENPNSSYSYWELQRRDHFTGGKHIYQLKESYQKYNQIGDLFSDECFRLKNLATGLFLTQDPQKLGKLQLTQNGKDEDCYFYIKKDKTTNERKKIYQQDTFKIYNFERKYIAANQIEKVRLDISLQKKISGVSLPYLHAFITTEKHVVDFIEQALQIYNTLLQFHFYLQNFGIVIDKQKKQLNSEKVNEETIFFSYQEACLQQKNLESEYQHVLRALIELENLLMKDSNDNQFSLLMKQQILREQKVLELLVLLARLIDVMSHGSKSTQGSKDKSKHIRNIKNVSEKSPLFIVNKHLQQLPIKIYNILYLGAKQNSNWSSYIFDNDDLFSGQLRYYAKEVGALLKESIKNLENFKNENSQGDEITEWVRLIEPLDYTKSNISDQIFFVEFISLAVMDPFQRPLQVYQNKCCNELFSKKDGRAIIQFHDNTNSNGVNISFFHVIKPDDIIANNKSLEDLGLEINKGDRCTFSLEKMSREAQDKDKNLQLYIKYISSVMTLLANLCRGRNKNSISLIKDILGINENHIFNSLRSSEIHISIKTSFLQLFEVIFLDDEPFLSLARSENRSFIWNDIEKKNFNCKTAEIFQQLQQVFDDSVKNNKQFDQRFLQILIDFWEKGQPEFEINYLTQKLEKEEKGRAQLQFLISVMKVTRTAMDLGQFNTEKIEFIVNQAIQTLSAFVGFNVQKNLFQSDHWIKRFINKVIAYGDFDQELEAIIIEVSNIIRLYLRIKLNLQICAILKKFYQEYILLKNRKKQRDIQDDYQQIIQNFTITMKSSVNQAPKDTRKKKTDILNVTAPIVLNRPDEAAFPLNKQDGGSANGDNPGSFNNIFSDHNNIQRIGMLEQRIMLDKSYVEEESLNASKVENMLLVFLLSKEKQTFSIAYEHITETLKLAMNHVDQFFEELQNVELIFGDEETNLYRLIENGSESQIISFFKLESLINALLFDEQSKSKTLKSESTSAQINKLIYKINEEFKEISQSENHILLQKFQNILRNLRIHKSISNLLTLNPQQYLVTLECVIRFLINFCKNNEQNKKEILPRFDDLLNIINLEVGAEVLLGIILQSVCQRELEFKPYLQSIFQKLNSPNTTRVGQTHIFEMLLSVLKKQNKIPITSTSDQIKLQKRICFKTSLIPENQQKILNLILQINPIQLFLEQHKHYSDFQKGNKPKQEVYQEIQMYKSLMKLISTLAENNQLSIIQCQRLMIYEDMKQFLLSPQTPFIIKLETFKVLLQMQYLRFINQLIIKIQFLTRYIQQNDESMNNFSIIEMNEILQNVILKDLTQFSKYIDGLVYIRNHSLEPAQILQQKIKECTKEFFEDKSQNIEKPILQSFATKSALQKDENNIDIFDSSKEYWDYLYTGHNWNSTKDGLLQIILDCYQEINKRGWLNFQIYESETPTMDQETLTDQLLLIKLVCSNIRGVLKKIQNKFDIDLSELIYMLSECVIQNTVQKEFNSLKNIKQGQLSISGLQQKLKESTIEDLDCYVKSFEEIKMIQINEQIQKDSNSYYRLQELEKLPREPPKEFLYKQERTTQRQVPISQAQIKQKYLESIQQQKNSIYVIFIFFDKLKFLIDKKLLTTHQIYRAFDSFQASDAEKKEEIQLERNRDSTITKDQFILKFITLLKDISIYGIKDSNIIGYDDIYFFFDAFSLQNQNEQDQKQHKNQQRGQGTLSQRDIQIALNIQAVNRNNEIEKLDFLYKLLQYIQNNSNFSSESNEQIVLLQFEKSYKQSESFKYFTNIFKQASLEIGKEKPFQQFATNIMNELLMCNDSDQRRKIKVFFEQIVNLLKKKEHQYFLILHNFIEELAFVQNQSITSPQHQHKSTNVYSQQLDQFGSSFSSRARESKKIYNPQKFLRISQNLIWNQKLYYQILVTISDIYGDTQTFANLNKQAQQQAESQNQGQNYESNNNNNNLYQQVRALVSKKKENTIIVLNCMKIINGLYSLNLKHSHAQLISILKKSSNIKITRNFLSFIKQSFTNYLQAIENLSNQDSNLYILYKEKKEELQLQEEIVLQVLKVIENSCELCNEEFQNFFRVQNIASSQSYVPLNILSEILYFLTNFTKFKSSYFSTLVSKPQSGDDSRQNLRYYLVINQCLATLKNLCNGTSPKNKDVLLNNSHFLIQLNYIITESNLDLQSENLNDIRVLQTISNCIDLLLTIIVCSNNQSSLLRLISIMNMEKIIKLLNFIYHYKIKSRLKIIQQEQQCTHQNSLTCSTSVCYKKFITYHDQLIMRVKQILCYQDFLLISFFSQKVGLQYYNVNEEEMNIKLRLQEENTLLLSIFIQMKKKDDFSDVYNKSSNGKGQEDVSLEKKSLIQRKSTNDRQSKIFDSKKSQIFKSRTYKKYSSSKKSTTLHNIMYNEIREDESSKNDEQDKYQQEQLVQDMGLQKDMNPPNKMNIMRKERMYLKESLSFYIQFVGSVEIVKDKQISKLFFRIPLLSSYLTHSIRKNLIQRAVSFSDKNRLKLLVRYSEYFQQEMRFCQNLSKHQLIIYAVEYRSYLVTLLYILILIINLVFLFKLTLDSYGNYNLPDKEQVVFNAIKLIHLIFSCFNMIIVTIERYPVVTYQKFIELKQTYRNQICQYFLKHPIVAFAFDFDFIYYAIYLILAFSALGNIIIYSVLLIDIIKQSIDLRQLVLVFSLNFRKLFKTAILCFLIIYIYSLIGAKSFTKHFTESESIGNINSSSSVDFYSFFSITLLEGLLNPQGISQTLVIPGTQNEKYWGRFFYDISFWLLINFLFLNLMLGQIIDSYSEFRNLQRKYEKNIKRKCFICGLTVEDLEGKTLDWDNHIKYEHNLNNYLNYIIYIKSKPIDECDGIEKYVKECISKEQTDFFPQRNTLAIERFDKKKL